MQSLLVTIYIHAGKPALNKKSVPETGTLFLYFVIKDYSATTAKGTLTFTSLCKFKLAT